MSAELPITMLACARLGVIHSVVFGGFAPSASADRIVDSQSRVLIVTDAYYRAGKLLNHKFNADEYLFSMPAERVAEIHLAGYEDKGTHLLDTHSRPVTEPVWKLFKKAIQHVGDVPVLIEWDNDIPSLERVVEESATAQKLQQQVLKNSNEP